MIVITPPEKRDGLDGKGPGIDYFIISPKNVVLDKFASQLQQVKVELSQQKTLQMVK